MTLMIDDLVYVFNADFVSLFLLGLCFRSPLSSIGLKTRELWLSK